MKIIILGAGQVGSSVAYNLASESNDITLVDTNEMLLRDLQAEIVLQDIVDWIDDQAESVSSL